MSITIKLNDLVQSNSALLELGEVSTFPPPAAFKIARVIRKSRDEVKGWSEQRSKILRAVFANNSKALKPHPQSPGEVWLDTTQITTEEADALAAQVDALGATEVTIDAGKIQLLELGENPRVKPNVLATLDWLLVEKL